MKKERSFEKVIDYVLGEEFDDEDIELAIRDIADSRPDLQELQNILEEGNNMLDIVGDQYLCSDIEEMMPELVEMGLKEIEISNPEIWKHISACKNCQQMFFAVDSGIKDLDNHLDFKTNLSDDFSLGKIEKKWVLKEIRKKNDKKIFHVVSGWLKNFDLPSSLSEKNEINFSFDDPPEIDDAGNFKMSLKFANEDMNNQTLSIELRDDTNCLKLIEEKVINSRIDVVLDLKEFPVRSIFFPPDAISVKLVSPAYFIEFLRELKNKNLSPISLVSQINNKLLSIGKQLEEILEQELKTYQDKIQIREIIEYTKNKIVDYVNIWIRNNDTQPPEYKLIKPLENILNLIHSVPSTVRGTRHVINDTNQVHTEPKTVKGTRRVNKKSEEVNGG